MGFQSKTFSLSDEVVTWLEELRSDYGSINKGLQAIMAVNEDVERGVSRATKERLDAQGAPSAVCPDPRQIPGVSIGANSVKSGFPCRCVHSGCRGAKFTGMARFQSICPECLEGGHAGDPRNCQTCANDSATGAI